MAGVVQGLERHPPVSEPSPITAITLCRSPERSRAFARPTAAEMEVLLCPVVKTSCSLSSGLGNPLSLPNCRRVENRAKRPVSSLCT